MTTFSATNFCTIICLLKPSVYFHIILSGHPPPLTTALRYYMAGPLFKSRLRPCTLEDRSSGRGACVQSAKLLCPNTTRHTYWVIQASALAVSCQYYLHTILIETCTNLRTDAKKRNQHKHKTTSLCLNFVSTIESSSLFVPRKIRPIMANL